MPYITKYYRCLYDEAANTVVNTFLLEKFSEGELNYFISKIVWRLFDAKPSYARANALMGVLECVKQEFYRRKVAPYEDAKMKENGDL